MYHKTMYIVNMYYIAKLHTWCTTYHKTIDLVWQNEIYNCAKWHLLSLYFWDKISYMHILACPPVHAAPLCLRGVVPCSGSQKKYISHSRRSPRSRPREPVTALACIPRGAPAAEYVQRHERWAEKGRTVQLLVLL